MAMNALLGGGKNTSHGSSSNNSSNPLGNLGSLASQFLGGGSHGSGGSSSSGAGKNSSAGKLVGQLASSFMGSATATSEKPPPPQNYHGGQSSSGSQHQQGGLAGAVMGGVAHMFGGKPSSGVCITTFSKLKMKSN